MAENTQAPLSSVVSDAKASSQLFEIVYADLKRMARSRLYRHGRVDELDTTALFKLYEGGAAK